MNQNQAGQPSRARRLAAWGVALALTAAAPLVPAHEGHDHAQEDARAAIQGNAPQRLPDGSLFVPKPTQRQLVVRTQPAVLEALAPAIELSGRVIVEPNRGGRVQATVPGRVEPGPRGLPVLGQAVRAGEALAYLRPTADPLSRANQAASAAELKGNLELAKRRRERLRQLEGLVPQKDIDAAEAEVVALTARSASVSSSLDTREALTAPVSGVIAAAQVVAGQVVDARELLFEIVDPTAVMVEALAFDPAQAELLQAASLALPDGSVLKLGRVGAGQSLRDGALPVWFRAEGNRRLPLVVGQTVRLSAPLAGKVDGIAVPAAAVVKGPDNLDRVWVHTAPERFEPRQVQVAVLDGRRLAVTAGLKAGDRVVVSGAPLLAQIR